MKLLRQLQLVLVLGLGFLLLWQRAGGSRLGGVPCTGGAAPYDYTVSAGGLPGGLNLASNGSLSGAPNAPGTFNFTIKATDANGCFGTRSYTVTISAIVNNGLQFYPLAHPVRLLETRNNPAYPGCFKPNTKIKSGAAGIRTQSARGVGDGLTIPANAMAITCNISTVESGGGYLTLWPSTATQPTVATSNFTVGQIFNRHFTVGLGANDGAFKIFVSGATDLVIDLSGYFAP